MKILTMKSLRINQKHDLVALAKKGEKDAFISLIQQNKVNLYRVAKAMLHNETDVEDAIQMTILKAYEKLGGLRKNKYFKTWLIRILINECNKAIKDRKQIAVLDYQHGNHLISEDTYENIDLQAAIHSLKAELRGNEVHSEKSFTEEPFIIPNGSITSGNLELNASASNEEGTFTDKQKKHYQGVAIFYLNKGSFQDLGSSNSEYAYGETALKGQQIDLQAIPERFTLGFHLDNLGSEEVMKGNWNFSIPIESEKAKGNVKEVSIDEDLAGIGAKIGVEKLIITPIRTYLQSKMTDENSYIDYLISDDKGNVLRYVGGSVQGHYIGEERLISYYETNSTAINWYSIIPYEYSKTRGEGVTLNKTGETLLPIDKNEFLTITKTVVENGKTYMYYQSDVPVSNYLPFTLIDETGFEYMRDLEESKMEQGKVSFLVFDGDLLNKKLKVYNPNTYYYDKEFTVNIQ